MTWTRRRFLVSSSTICAGAAIAGSSLAPLLSRPGRDRLRLLTSSTRSAPAAAFERGVRAALGGAASDVDVDALAMPVRSGLAQWRELGASIRGVIVLGVVSVSGFVLVNELIREAGARLLYQGEHSVDATGAARHTSTTGTASVGVDSWLTRSSGAWPEALGFALARVAVRRWEPAAAMAGAFAPHAGAPVCSSCVSFVFAA